MASWFFIHYRKSVTSNTFQFQDDSESKSAINKTFCGHRLHWFKKTVTFQFTNFYFYFWQICRRRSTRSSRWNRRSPAHFENPGCERHITRPKGRVICLSDLGNILAYYLYKTTLISLLYWVSNCPSNMPKYNSTKYHYRNLHEV